MLTERDREVVLAFAKNNMDAAKAARDMPMHRNSVIYHLERVKKKTGLNPLVFYDLVKLVGGADHE